VNLLASKPYGILYIGVAFDLVAQIHTLGTRFVGLLATKSGRFPDTPIALDRFAYAKVLHAAA